jgi:hypothetical protein
MSDITQRLLDAHVAYQLAQGQGQGYAQLIDEEVAALFEWLAEVKLDDAVTRAQIKGVIERFVIDPKVTGALTELSGEMSRLVLSSAWSERTRVDEILRHESYVQFADKIVALDGLWRELVHLVAQSNAYAALVSRTLQRGLLDVVFGEDRAGAATLESRGVFDGLRAKLRPLIVQRLEPHVSSYLEALIKQLARRSERRVILALDPEAMRTLLDELWDSIAPMRLSEAFGYISSHDLEDFVALGYEFWLKYRKTRYFREISGELVDHFFDKYGDESLLALLEELGISEEVVSQELHGFLRPLLDHGKLTGWLERRIRTRLERFYRSDAAASILAPG